MRAVRELDYHPNTAARSLASPVLRTVGVLFRRQRSTIDANDLDYVDGVRRALAPSGIQVFIPVMTSSAPLIELRSLVRSGALGGVVLMDVADGDEREAMLLEEKVPTVLIGSSGRAGGASGIDADFAQMARAGVDHLSGLGHRRIVALMRETASDDAHARHRARAPGQPHHGGDDPGSGNDRHRQGRRHCHRYSDGEAGRGSDEAAGQIQQNRCDEQGKQKIAPAGHEDPFGLADVAAH